MWNMRPLLQGTYRMKPKEPSLVDINITSRTSIVRDFKGDTRELKL